MSLETTLQQNLDAHLELVQESRTELVSAAREIGTLVANTFRNGGRLYLFGNGGSAADAQHVAAEFVNRYRLERPPLPAIALTTDTSTLTSIANDYDFRDIFAKQVRALVAAEDVVVGISTSGTSDNVVEGLRAARSQGAHTVALLGRSGGEARNLADIVFIAPHEETGRIQEVHLLLEHLICDTVEYQLFLAPDQPG